MKLVVRHGGGELTVPSQKEFLVLSPRGFVAPDDLVRREGAGPDVKWVRADELSWIRGSALDAKKDGRRLFGLTLVLMVLGLCGVIYIQGRAAKLSRARPAAASAK
jgi:hypothetical protein